MNRGFVACILLCGVVPLAAQPDRSLTAFESARLASGRDELRIVENGRKVLRSDELLLISMKSTLTVESLAKAAQSSGVSGRGLYWCVPRGGVYAYHFGPDEAIVAAGARGQEQMNSAGKAIQAAARAMSGPVASPIMPRDPCGIDVVGPPEALARFVKVLGQAVLVAEATSLRQRRYAFNRAEEVRK